MLQAFYGLMVPIAMILLVIRGRDTHTVFKKLLIILSLLTIPVNTWSAYNYNPFTDELDDIGDFSITDPNADRIIFWDDSEGAIGYLTAGTGLTISTTTLSVSNPSSWTTASNVAYLTTMTDTVSIGTSAAGGKLFIDGDADEIQLQVKGYSTQTNFLAVFENDSGMDVATISADGTFATGSGNGSIDIGSAGVRLSSDGDGAITFLGLGNGSDEDLTINLDDTSNTATVTSSTSLATINFSSIGLQESGVNVPTTTDICKTIESPVDADVFLVHRASKALTITATNCISESATSTVLTWQECDSAGDTCSTIESMTCDVDGAADSGGVDNASIDAGNWIRLDVGTVSGTPGHATACFTATDA